MTPAPYTEDTLVQQTTAEYLEQELGWESVYAYNNEDFGPDGLVDETGRYRSGGVGIFRGEQLVHMAPPAERVPKLMADLLDWLENTNEHPLVASCLFHYEFEFIHPFADGNGRMGRLWQTLILRNWMRWMSRHRGCYSPPAA